ncbi:hypothetical protein D0T12_34325 [Actinomadura spongiicola]|uniref:Uncharacterized protein n=1 Tax=Actinomadura spongiicola TaxID=2303421 RepID=A0A372G6M3_9ACTN|nr:hypothetical protein [Actinomadura spongiicola]RFS81011.1 hypothetical protein D0T12_34325 [Actinomadura spongiicola]
MKGFLRRWAAVFPPVLTGVSIAGLWGMSALEERADRTRLSACIHNPSAAHWSHGYDAWLPFAVLTSALLGAVLAAAVLLSNAQTPRRLRAACYPTMVIALIALFPAATAVDDYYNLPGADFSSLNSPPCPKAHSVG